MSCIVHRNKSLTRLLSGAVVAAVTAGAGLLAGGVANADPPTGDLGTLTITPSPGSDLSAASARTSAGCPTTANAANLLITGPVGATNPTFPPANPYLLTTGHAAFSTDGAFDLPFRKTLKDAAVERSTTLQPGEYDLSGQCVDGLAGTVFGTFTGAIYFTTPTLYQTTNPASES